MSHPKFPYLELLSLLNLNIFYVMTLKVLYPRTPKSCGTFHAKNILSRISAAHFRAEYQVTLIATLISWQ